MSRQYSVLPTAQKLIDHEQGESVLMIMCRGMSNAQMNLSRLIMYKEEDYDRRELQLVRSAMDVIADVYERFLAIEDERKKYDELTKALEE